MSRADCQLDHLIAAYLERSLHLTWAKHAEITALLGTRAVTLSRGEFSKFLGELFCWNLVQASKVFLEDTQGFVLGAGDVGLFDQLRMSEYLTSFQLLARLLPSCLMSKWLARTWAGLPPPPLSFSAPGRRWISSALRPEGGSQIDCLVEVL